MAAAARRLVTVAEFLAFEGEPDRRYEPVGSDAGLGVERGIDERYAGLLPGAEVELGRVL